MEKELLSWCHRCHRKFEEMGEILKWGKHYPACRVKHIDGTEENLPESMEIVEAICKSCMVEVNSNKFETEMKRVRCQSSEKCTDKKVDDGDFCLFHSDNLPF